jgi:uncharacterized repeat protein (TIGR03803 family)
MRPSRLLPPLSFLCVFVTLISISAIAQSGPPPVNPPNELPTTEQHRLGFPQVSQGAPFVKRVSREGKAAASPLAGSQASALNFAPVVLYNSGGQVSSAVVIADVNHDGKADVIASNECANSETCAPGTVGVLLGNGDGTFQTAVTYDSGGYGAINIAVADVNGDAHPDILVANTCVNSSCDSTGVVTLLLANGDGTFQSPTTVAYFGGHNSYFSIAVADVNGDGKADLMVSNGCLVSGFSGGWCTNVGQVGVFLGNGDGTFQQGASYASGGYYAIGVSVADVNRDGKPDLVVSNQCAGSGNCTNGVVGVLLGNGDGTFGAVQTYNASMPGVWASGGYSSWSVSVADVNGDGNPDLVVSNQCGNCTNGVVGVLLGNGDGTFQTAVGYDSGGESPTSVAVADMNGDGKPDLVVANNCSPLGTCEVNSDGVAAVLLGNGDGTFRAAVAYDSGALYSDGLAVGDFNADGKPDVVVANYYPPSGQGGVLGVLINTGAAQTYTVIHSFAGAPMDGRLPNGELIQDAAGNLYGTSYAGGTTDNGTVFKLNSSGEMTILHNFTLDERDGYRPEGGLLLDSEDSLYGTTTHNGFGGGTAFRLDANNVFKTLHIFGLANNDDGIGPWSRLVTINGDLYGVTPFGAGTGCNGSGCGLIFKMTKNAGTETVLYRFTGGADGAFPQGLVRDSAGNLYGVTTSNITAPGAGTVFELDTAGVFTVLYTFTGGGDGGTPSGRLIRDANGNIHGVTAFGGDPTCNCGVIFRLDSSGHETVLHKFFGYAGGSYPSGGTGSPSSGLLDVNGVLYGTTLYGGDLTCYSPLGCGVLYMIGKTGQYTVLHRFAGAAFGDGYYPGFGELTLGSDGSIFGATWHGGTSCTFDETYGCGAIFKYTP